MLSRVPYDGKKRPNTGPFFSSNIPSLDVRSEIDRRSSTRARVPPRTPRRTMGRRIGANERCDESPRRMRRGIGPHTLAIPMWCTCEDPTWRGRLDVHASRMKTKTRASDPWWEDDGPSRSVPGWTFVHRTRPLLDTKTETGWETGQALFLLYRTCSERPPLRRREGPSFRVRRPLANPFS